MAKYLPDDLDFAAYMAETGPKRKVLAANLWVDDLISGLTERLNARRVVLPWQKSHDSYEFRMGEVTLWAGVNGHGKSLMTGQAIMSLVAQGERVCVASFEMKPRKTLERMARQFTGERMDGAWMQDRRVIESFTELLEQFGIFTSDRLWLYDQQGTVKTPTILGVLRYCANELKIRQVFIDNLAKCIKGADDYNAQADFVDELCAAARDLNIHIHLVHHIKKLSSETEIPGKFDVKGAGEIVDQVDNLLIVWRNTAKEKALAAKKLVKPEEPDAYLICEKQRNGEWQGRWALWYEPDSQQFVANPGASKLDFTGFPHHG